MRNNFKLVDNEEEFCLEMVKTKDINSVDSVPPKLVKLTAQP